MFEPLSKNNSVAVKLKIKIWADAQAHHTHIRTKEVKQTHLDVVDVTLTADNNGWKVKSCTARMKKITLCHFATAAGI